MAAAKRTMDTDILQVRTVYARGADNSFIPSSHVLVAKGNGETRWSSIYSIVSTSFTGLKGVSGPTFVADASNTTLYFSTTGLNILKTYADASAVLYLSTFLPPTGVLRGSIAPGTEAAAAAALTPANPSATFLTLTNSASTLKFFGVGDIRLSTISGSDNAIFTSISSFTSVGYSTISGETFGWRPALYSTLSTAHQTPSFISSVPFVASNWNWGTGLTMSTTGNDLYFSSIGFDAADLCKYVDVGRASSTKLFLEVHPQFLFPPMATGTGSLVKAVSSYLFVNTVALGPQIIGESVNTSYLTSQLTAAGSSNFYQTPLRLEIDPYQTLLSFSTTNAANPMIFKVFHRIVGGKSDGSTAGFSNAGPFTLDNLTSKQGGAHVEMFSAGPPPP